ncbi:hypothetical protein [Aporhodopirellula aestuarii]|nr:hypothetical protein [Aporhodopirellula aestuarii]
MPAHFGSIIVVSSYESNELAPNPLVVDYLVKPISITDLKSAIGRASGC